MRVRVPEASAQLSAQVTALAQELRTQDLYKVPGVSETIDWAAALVALQHEQVTEAAIEDTIGVVLKAREDVDALRGGRHQRAARARHGARRAGRMSAGAGDALLARLLGFERLLRRLGLDVHTGRMLDVVEALPYVDLGRRDDVFHVLRRCSCTVTRTSRPSIAPSTPSGARRPAPEPPDALTPDPERAPGPGRAAPDREAGGLLETPIDTSAVRPTRTTRSTCRRGATPRRCRRRTSPSSRTPSSRRREWPSSGSSGSRGSRRTRRWVAGRGLAPRSAAGAAFERAHRRRHGAPAAARAPAAAAARSSCSATSAGRWRCTRGCSSTSPTPSRGATAASRRSCFRRGSRASRAQLRAPRIDDAVRAVSRAVPDWSGGTRIGASLQEFHRRWGRRALARGPVVLLVSDGWDRGDPERARRRRCRGCSAAATG